MKSEEEVGNEIIRLEGFLYSTTHSEYDTGFLKGMIGSLRWALRRK